MKTNVIAIGLLLLAGCRTAPKTSDQFEPLLRTVSYESSVGKVHEPQTASARRPIASPAIPSSDETKTISSRLRSFGKRVGDASKTVAAVTAWSLFNLVDMVLRSDDDKPDLTTARGRADANFNGWLEAREQWRKEDKRDESN